MQYWQSVLDEVLHKMDDKHPFLFTSRGSLQALATEGDASTIREIPAIQSKKGRPRALRHYFLGPKFPDVYLTNREAQCMFYLVQEITISAAAERLKLSARTVEFYVKNLKLKLRCESKKQ